MNYKLLTMAAGLFVSVSAVAGPLNVKQFPARKAPEAAMPAQQAAGMQRAPLNPYKDAGTKVFGYTNVDFDGTRHYVDFYTGQPRQLNKLHTIPMPGMSNYDDDQPRWLWAYAGVWAGDAYYTYRTFYYTAGYLYLHDWNKVDVNTGEPEIMYQHHFYIYQNDQGFTLPQSLLWNPNKPEGLQVLAQNDNGTTTSMICEVDREDGMYTKRVANLKEYYFTAAYDYDNTVYAIRWKYNDKGAVTGTILDIFDCNDFSEPMSSRELTVDGKPWYIYYDNSLTIDHTTGDLWWAATQVANMPQIAASETPIQEEIKYALVKIDPDNFSTVNYGTLGTNEQVGGMYIKYETAESRMAPAQVKNLNFAIDQTGAQKVTLSWTNPSTTWGRKTLSNLSEVYIYRDNSAEPVAKVAASGKAGQAMTWVDETAANGVHNYTVRAVNAEGKGVPASIDAFVGKDVPGPVTNLTAVTPEGKTIQLSWGKPDRGDNDGWFDDSDLTYTITRLPDNKVIGTTKELSFHDQSMDEALLFSYQVTATNAQGTGSIATSNAVLAGKSIVLPFHTGFENQVEADRFTAIDKNHDGTTWEYAFNLKGGGVKHMYQSHTYSCDDILVSPSFLVEKDKTYKVVYAVRHFSHGETGNTINRPYRVLGGTAATEEGMTTVYLDQTENVMPVFECTQEYVAYFKAPITGEYYIGLEDLTADKTSTGTFVESVDIEYVPDDDLAAKSVSTHRSVSTIDDNVFTVEVYNNGSTDQSNYTVKVAYLNENSEETVIAQTDEVPELKSHESDFVEITGRPVELGEFEIYAVVELATDGNADNNRSPKLKVSFDEAPAFNFTVNSFDKLNDDTFPVNHYNQYSAGQTIYSPDMTAFDRIFQGKTPAITRLAWVYKGNQSALGSNIKVYLTQTDYKGFAPENVTDPALSVGILPLAAGTKPLFDGQVDFVLGENNYMVVDLDDEFEFDPAKSFVVTVVKDDPRNTGVFPVHFQHFDNDWYSSVMHSYQYQSSGEAYNIAEPAGRLNIVASAPVLHLAVNADYTGIDEVVLTGKGAVYFNALTGTVETVDYAMASVEVYTLGGQIVKTVAVAEGAASAAIDCNKGMYLLKVNGVDGSSISLKAIVK